MENEILKKHKKDIGWTPPTLRREAKPEQMATSAPVLRYEKQPVVRQSPWDQEIKEMETFFSGRVLPDSPIKLNRCSTINDPGKFVLVSLETIRANNGIRTFRPCLDMLKELREYIIRNCN